jgi:hypothetical protein
MRKIIKQLSGKLGFTAAISLAAVIGGISTGVGMASIPDSNGGVNSCYRNSASLTEPEGGLRVIDTATENCAGNETALGISQPDDSSTAYFRVKNGVIDTSTLRNIADYDFVDTGNIAWCLEIAFTPLSAQAFSSTSGNVNQVYLEGMSNDIDTAITSNCSPNHNAFLEVSSVIQDVAASFTE